MWTVEHRRAYERDGLRYPSDLTDAEWALVEPLIPPAKRGGRKRTADVREVLNGILYVLATGCQWRGPPPGPPPRRTGHRHPRPRGRGGAARGPAAQEHGPRLPQPVGLGRHARAPAPRALRPGSRAGGQGGEPDRRDRRQPERQGRRKRGARVDPSGYDAGKKVEGKKRHILVDTLGLLLTAVIHPADVHDRDGGLPVLCAARRPVPFVRVLLPDGGYPRPVA